MLRSAPSIEALNQIEAVLDAHLQRITYAPLRDAMAYSALSGGKRVRALLTVHTAALFADVVGDAVRVAAAIEAVHSYSLIHDDLPAMDDDDMRRGKPSLHRATDEATAILAGDALLTAAFEILSDPLTAPDAALRIALVADLAQAIGARGMVAGQLEDMASCDNIEALERIHRGKTGALIEYAVLAGARLGAAGDKPYASLQLYAQKLGLAFQIRDDILDATVSSQALGKTAGKDKQQNKLTFVSAYGLADASQRADALMAEAISHLSGFGPAADPLRQIARFVIERQN